MNQALPLRVIDVDVREAPLLRSFPRYVPCAISVLAVHLELFRLEVGLPVRIAANGGYRSPSLEGADPASPHAWGTAANTSVQAPPRLPDQRGDAPRRHLVSPPEWRRRVFRHRRCRDGDPGNGARARSRRRRDAVALGEHRAGSRRSRSLGTAQRPPRAAGGFSTHYNVSIPVGDGRRLDRLARLLTYLLPVPLMLLAANKRSTGIGVRPRVTRIEVTADFTPDAALQVATATFVAGVVRRVARWRTWSLAELRRRRLPVIAGFAPRPQTSRKGWLAKDGCYPRSPFTASPDAAIWALTEGGALWTLRELAQRIFHDFRWSVARVSDPFTLRLIRAIFAGRATSLLDLPDRPATYDDVGRLCRWSDVFPARFLRRSRYERVLMLAIAGKPITLGGQDYEPTAMRGWSQVVLRRMSDGKERVMSVDELVPWLEKWTEG